MAPDVKQTLDFLEALSRLGRKEYYKVCLASSAECTSGVSKCHAISSAAVLKRLSKDGKLREVKFSKGEVRLQRSGVNVATTFTGFCNFHDSTIFKDLDSLTLRETELLRPEIINLMNLRVCAKELWAKLNNESFSSLVLNSLNNKSGGIRFRDKHRQNIESNRGHLMGNLMGTRKAIVELRRAFSSHCLIKTSGNYHLYRSLEFKVPLPIPFCVSNLFTPQVNLQGQRILRFMEKDWASMYIHVLPFEDHARIIFSWHKRFQQEAEVMVGHLQGLYLTDRELFLRHISMIVCGYTDTIAFTESVFTRWSEKDIKKMCDTWLKTAFNLENIDKFDKPNFFNFDRLY